MRRISVWSVLLASTIAMSTARVTGVGKILAESLAASRDGLCNVRSGAGRLDWRSTLKKMLA